MDTITVSEPRPAVVNGVDTEALMDTIRAVKADPGLAEFRFRASNRWLGGDRNRSTIDGYWGTRQEHRRAEPFVLDNAEPPILLGGDGGANPVEHLLNALAGCLTTTMAYHAASRGIAIEAISSELEGDLDLRGFLGLSKEVRKGYQNIRVRMRVRCDAAPDTLAALAKFSPVFDTVSRSVPTDVIVETY